MKKIYKISIPGVNSFFTTRKLILTMVIDMWVAGACLPAFIILCATGENIILSFCAFAVAVYYPYKHIKSIFNQKDILMELNLKDEPKDEPEDKPIL